MPLDPHAQRFLAMLALGGPPAPTVAGRRAALRDLARLAGGPLAAGVSAEDLVLPGPGGPLPARLYAPEGAAGPGPGLVYFHGGGFVAGGLDTHDGLCRGLVASAGCRLLAVDYRLAPEHPFPAAFEDGAAAVAWAAAQAGRLGIDPGRLGVGGDSAGAAIAAHAARVSAHGKGPTLAFQVLLCPVLDAEGAGPSRAAFASGYLLDAETIRRDADSLGIGPAEREDPRLSPLRAADLAGLPPALIHTAEYDIVRDDGTAYAARLAEAGVPVRHTCHAGMIHDFYGLVGLIPAARAARARIGADLAAILAAGTAEETPAAA
ncbi:alpha/beta hydrolase [Methylobacterium sp. A54F]